MAAIAALSTMTAAGVKPTPAEAVNRYIMGLPALTAKPESDRPAGPATTSTTVVDQTKYRCQTTPKTLTANPDDIVALNADAGKLWLGGLLQGRGYAGGPGSLAELPIRNRAPLTIYTDLPGRHIAKTVKAPTGATVKQAINSLVAEAQRTGVQPPAAYSYASEEAQSAEEALLKAGISLKYLGVKASASLGMSRTAGQSSVLVTITQRMFTVSMVKPSTPAGYFGRNFTVKDLKVQAAARRIGPANPPVAVSHIVYGRKLIYSVTAKSSVEELKDALSFSADTKVVSGTLDQEARWKAVLSSARYSVVAVGGDESATRSLIADRKIRTYLAGQNALSSAVPISYQVDNVVDDSAAAFSETTKYNLTTCAVVPPRKVLVGAVVKIDGLRGEVKGPCKSPALFGALLVNGTTVWERPDAKPYAGPAVQGEFNFPGLSLPTGAPLEPKYRHNLEPGQFALFKDPGRDSITISGNVTQSKWIGHYPVNLYDYKLTYPVPLGEHTIKGGSPNCKVNLKFNLIHVVDLEDEVPDSRRPV
ncbi:hypothetical protein Acsp02_11900 [Actinoplanes sp. NBRC 103695]|nr:hypothetical protein Acsp02_11900 [Actinoplanes sp. NBRC 103695]